MKFKSFIYSKISIVIQAFLIMAWLHYLAPTDAIYFVYGLCSVAAVFCLYHNFQSRQSDAISDVVISIFAAAVLAVSVALANYHLYLPLTDIKPLFGLLCTLSGGVVVFFHITVFLLHKVSSIDNVLNVSIKASNVFWTSFAFISIINLIYLLFVEYPGIISNDTRTQLYQVFGESYSNHHPFYHTIVMEICVKIGYLLFHNYNSSFAVYSVWQILFMAFSFSYTVKTLFEAGIPKKICLCLILFYGLMPYNITHSIYATKDVVFTGALLICVVSMYRIIKNCGANMKWNYFVFTVSSLLTCIWRSNGIIAYAVCFLIAVVFMFKHYWKMVLIMGGVLCTAWILTNPVLAFLNVQQPDTVEALSIPVQQVARVIADGKELTQEQYELLSRVVDLEEVPEIYTCWLSDPIKLEIVSKDNAYFEENISQYAKLWVEIGLRYPIEYLKAWIDQTKGYWNGGYDYFIHVSGVVENTLGIYSPQYNHIFAKLFRGLLRVSRGLVFLDPFESIGLNVWLLFILMVVNLKKKRCEAILSVPAISVILTLMIATPVYSQFRYAYPAFVTVPFVLLTSIYKARNE